MDETFILPAYAQKHAEPLHPSLLQGKKQDVTGAYRTSVEEGNGVEEQDANGIGNVLPSIGVGAEEIQNPRLPDALTR